MNSGRYADKMQELAAALASAHPKIQKMCEEESEDAEAVAKLLEINDSIHRTIERYKLMKAGNIDAANKIEKGTLGSTTGVGKNAANELSLIDFDPEPSASAESSNANGSLLDSGMSAPATAKPTTVEDDLLGLSLGDSDSGQLGSISLGPTTSFANAPPPGFMNSAQFPSAQGHVAAPPASPKPNYDIFASLTSALPPSKPSTPTPTTSQQRPATQAALDPFAALVSGGSHPSTPRSSTPIQPRPQPAAAAPQVSGSAAGEDEWLFESSLPTPAMVQVHSSQIKIEFEPRRIPGQPTIQMTAYFSNTTHQRITGLHFQVAVEKSYTLQLKPQSGRELAPKAERTLRQEILLNGILEGKGDGVKMRFKVAYELNGQKQEEQGTVPSLGIK